MSCSATNYNVGDKPRLSGTLSKTDGSGNVDSNDIYAWYCNPAGEKTILHYGEDAELLRTGPGIYYFDLSLNASGSWYYGFYSTGSNQAASADGKIVVKSSQRL